MNTRPTDVEGYLSALADDFRVTLEQIRRTIREAAPGAVESISYGVPTFKYKGKPLIYFGAGKKHCAVYGASMAAFREELAGYDTGKGTIRFPPGEPLPDELLTRIVVGRMAEIDAAEVAKPRKRNPQPPTS